MTKQKPNKSLLRNFLVIVLLLVGLSCSLGGQTPPSCTHIVRAAVAAGAAGNQIEQAMELVQDLVVNHSLQITSYVKVGDDLIGVVDPFAIGSDPISAADLISITNNQSVSEDELVTTIDALANYLRNPDGTSLFGVVLKTGQGDGSTRLIKNLASGNRGFFFEAAGTRSIILHAVPVQGRTITPANLLGMGVRASTTDNQNNPITVEGDLLLGAGGSLADFIDFKALNGNFTCGEVTRVFYAIMNQAAGQLRSSTVNVNSFTFAVENTVNLSIKRCPDVTNPDGTNPLFVDFVNATVAQLPQAQQSKLAIIQVSFQ